MSALDPMPTQDPISLDTPSASGEKPEAHGETTSGWMTGRWLQWFYNAIVIRLGAAPYRTGIVEKGAQGGQSGAITLTALPNTSAGGTIRLNWFLEILTGDPTAQVQLSITFTHNGSVRTILGHNFNPPAAGQIDAITVPIESDASSPVSYTLTNTQPLGPCTYYLRIVPEQLA